MASFPLAHQISTQGPSSQSRLPLPLYQPDQTTNPLCPNTLVVHDNKPQSSLAYSLPVPFDLPSYGLFSSTDLIENLFPVHFLLRNLSQWRVSWPLCRLPPPTIHFPCAQRNLKAHELPTAPRGHQELPNFGPTPSSAASLTFVPTPQRKSQLSSSTMGKLLKPPPRLTASPTSRWRSCEPHLDSSTTHRIDHMSAKNGWECAMLIRWQFGYVQGRFRR